MIRDYVRDVYKCDGASMSLAIFLFIIITSPSTPFILKMCALEKDDLCQNNQNCAIYSHKVDCLLSIQRNKSHFGIVSGEEAFLGAAFLDKDVVVLGEVVEDNSKDNKPLQTVVVVRIDIPNGFINLKNRTLCLPGYSESSTVSYLLLQEFENEIIKRDQNFCSDENMTLVEKRIKSLKDYFMGSCRPGPWTQHEEFNKRFKEKYKSLCKLCNNSTCDDENKTPFEDSLMCLTRNNADIAVTTLRKTEEFFKMNLTNAEHYKYFCKDGSTQPSTKPCIWSQELPKLLVGHKSVYNESKSTFQKYSENKIKINFFNSSKSLKNYVRSHHREIPSFSKSIQCNRILYWCTSSNKEQEKCMWLSQAARNWGIQPVIRCILHEDHKTCVYNLREDSSLGNITVISFDSAYFALSGYVEISNFYYSETENRSRILLIKKADSSINSFHDLKGRRACIPQYGGKEHLAFIYVLKKFISEEETKNDYEKILRNFVGDSCVPGSSSHKNENHNSNGNEDKLCKECSKNNCNPDETNIYFGSNGAIKCLEEGNGDFAVITTFDLKNDSNFKAICKNNSLSRVNGLNVTDHCSLAIIPNNIIILKDGGKGNDILLALYEFQKWFGENNHKYFHLFGKFDNISNLLFEDFASNLYLDINKSSSHIDHYKKMLEDVRNISKKNNSKKVPNSSQIHFFVTPLLSVLIIILIFNFFTIS